MAAKAELQAILDCDNKPFIRAMGEAVRRQKMAGAQMKKNFAGVGSAIAAAGKMFLPATAIAATVAAGKSVFNLASEVKDMADSVNLTTDQFQKYSFALEQAGANEESLVKSMGAIIAKLEEAKEEGGKSAEQLAKIGVSAEELKTIDPAEVFLRMSDTLQAANGNAESIAKVMDVVGTKVALKVVPALKDGRKAFLEMGESASIMSAQSVQAMEGLGDKLNQMKKKGMNNLGNIMGAMIGGFNFAKEFAGGQKFEPAPPQPDRTFIMDEIEVTPGRRPGFWQKDLPKFTKRMGGPQERMGPFPEESHNTPENWGGQFRGFSSGYFPGKSGGLTSSGGLKTGGLTSGGLVTGGSSMDSAYHRVRRGDAARAKKAAKEAAALAAKGDDPTVENTARLVEIWGGTGKRK